MELKTNDRGNVMALRDPASTAIPDSLDALLTRADTGAALRAAGYPVADSALATKARSAKQRKVRNTSCDRIGAALSLTCEVIRAGMGASATVHTNIPACLRGRSADALHCTASQRIFRRMVGRGRGFAGWGSPSRAISVRKFCESPIPKIHCQRQSRDQAPARKTRQDCRP